ncbi:MAG TPA: FAD-binding protein [Acidimicrobiales bacterium]|nr:FAD-binding protein [Acidimicrobiales bacterium]
MSRRDVLELDWPELSRAVGGRLVRVASPLQPCLTNPGGTECAAALVASGNPFFLQDEPGGFQTTGWHGAFTARHSPYAVVPETTSDVVGAVTFARDHGVGLVLKGTGHDYMGRSSDPASLLIWTHHMRGVTVHESFAPAGSDVDAGLPAVTVEAGTRWLEAYHAVSTRGRYVTGGGCTSVGAAGGFTQGGGFGSFSTRFGTTAGNVLELEVVTADGEILVANATQHPDLFWALRGGGGGTFGVVTKVTMRTYDPPETMGGVFGTITARDDTTYRQLVRQIVALVPRLDDEHWGEQIRFGPDNSVELMMAFLDLSDDEARSVWRPVLDWVDRRAGALSTDVVIASGPFHDFWDARRWDEAAPDMIHRDTRPGQSADHFWWASNDGEVSSYINAYHSRWLPRHLFEASPDRLAEALFDASRHSPFGLHMNKGLSGAAVEATARDRTTSVNPAVFDAATLLIMDSAQVHAFPGVPGHEPDPDLAASQARRIGQAMTVIRDITPGAGAYVNQADYFEEDWQDSFWGTNYPRLVEVKRRYDPSNLFCVHHGVGSEKRAAGR